MAVAVLAPHRGTDLNSNRMMRPSRRLERRHYKKDSRFVLDLYTLTYDSHESLDSLGDLSERRYEALDVQNMFSDNRSTWLRHNKNDRSSMAYRYRRPSLQSRLQDGKNLQLCFVNEQSGEFDENHTDGGVVSLPVIFQSKCTLNNMDMSSLPVENDEIRKTCYQISETTTNSQFNDTNNNLDSNYNVVRDESNRTNVNLDVTRWSSDLRDEVCAALKKVYTETCRKTDTDYRQRSDSPITCTIKSSLKKVGVEDGTHRDGRRRMNRHMLTRMNANQLQTIIDDLHSHVEYLNEQLMKMLMERDELHMSRDSLLVDIEDLTTYLDAKQVYKKNGTKFYISNENNYVKNNNYCNDNLPVTCTKNLISGLRFNRLTSYIKN